MLAVGTMWCSTSAHSFCFTETMPIDLLALENQIEVSTPQRRPHALVQEAFLSALIASLL